MPNDRPTPEMIGCVAQTLGFGTDRLVVDPVTSGVSTWVYQVQRGRERFYVRVQPEADASFIPEVVVHERLLALGLHVPHVVAAEDHHALLDRSVIVTTEIPGQPLSEIHPHDHRMIASVLRDAGQELALLNQIPVHGFGWIQRGQCVDTDLIGEYPSYACWVDALLTEGLNDLAGTVLSDTDVSVIMDAVATLSAARSTTNATLAHGDLDLTHIYHHDGHYTGIIDFGEIRGTDRWYDLAHFHLHDRERLPLDTFSWLLDGYRLVAPLPDDLPVHLAGDSVINGLVALARSHAKTGQISSPYQHFLLQAICRDVAGLRGVLTREAN